MCKALGRHARARKHTNWKSRPLASALMNSAVSATASIEDPPRRKLGSGRNLDAPKAGPRLSVPLSLPVMLFGRSAGTVAL